MNRGRLLPALAAGGTALIVAGCAHRSTPVSMDAGTQAELRLDVAAVARAAASGNASQAKSALSVLNTDLAAAFAAGRLSQAKLVSIRAQIAALQADLSTGSAGVPSTVSTTSTGPGSSAAPAPIVLSSAAPATNSAVPRTSAAQPSAPRKSAPAGPTKPAAGPGPGPGASHGKPGGKPKHGNG